MGLLLSLQLGNTTILLQICNTYFLYQLDSELKALIGAFIF
jgi:hypothetical protein